jgi:hypothetical protein
MQTHILDISRQYRQYHLYQCHIPRNKVFRNSCNILSNSVMDLVTLLVGPRNELHTKQYTQLCYPIAIPEVVEPFLRIPCYHHHSNLSRSSDARVDEGMVFRRQHWVRTVAFRQRIRLARGPRQRARETRGWRAGVR